MSTIPKISPKEKILAERGITINRTRRRSFDFKPTPTATCGDRTTLMKYLENKYHVNISDVLLSYSLDKAVKVLGNEVDRSTLSRWAKRLKLRYSKDNLPNCTNCKHGDSICHQGGVCYVLVSHELYDLVLLKREEMLNQGELS